MDSGSFEIKRKDRSKYRDRAIFKTNGEVINLINAIREMLGKDPIDVMTSAKGRINTQKIKNSALMFEKIIK